MKKSVQELWRSFDLEAWLTSMGLSYTLPVQAALCFGSGFAIGFLFKKYFKFFIGALVFSLILIKFLEYNTILLIDWEALASFLGFEQHVTFNQVVTTIFDWIKHNMIVFVTSIIGFLLGCKLG
jgi:uncharacterized membrane protein (Fun14 family)